MDKRIVKLTRDPFVVDLGRECGWWFVDPGTGNILFGSAGLQAWKGLAFYLVPDSKGHHLKLRYNDFTYDIGWTDDAVDAASWVEAVNRFLETKQGAADANGKPMPLTPSRSTVG